MSDPRVLALASAIVELLNVLAEGHQAPPHDELVAVAPKPLAALGLEYRPTLALAQAGTLRTVWIGRRRFTRRSWLAALAEALPPACSAQPEDDLAEAARRRASRRSLRVVGGGSP